MDEAIAGSRRSLTRVTSIKKLATVAVVGGLGMMMRRSNSSVSPSESGIVDSSARSTKRTSCNGGLH
eukprot:gene7970-1186_t